MNYQPTHRRPCYAFIVLVGVVARKICESKNVATVMGISTVVSFWKCLAGLNGQLSWKIETLVF